MGEPGALCLPQDGRNDAATEAPQAEVQQQADKDKVGAASFGEFKRDNTLGATGPRASERQTCLPEGLCFRGFQRFLEVVRGF